MPFSVSWVRSLWSKRFVLLLSLAWLWVLFLSSLSFAINYDEEIRKRQELLERVKKQLEQQERLIKARTEKERSLFDEINKLDKEIERLTLETKITDLKIRKLNAEIENKKKIITKLLEELEKRRALLAERIQAIYRYGRAGYIEALLRARTWESFALNSLYLRRIASYESSLIDDIERKEKELSREKAELEKKLKDLIALRNKLQAETASLNKKKAEREALLKKIRQEKELYQKAYMEFEELSKQLEISIRKLILEKQAAASRRVEDRGGFRVGFRRTKLIWPVDGPVTSGYGYRIHPIFKTRQFHAGIDIGAPAGTVVRAAAAGEVAYAGWLRGYGKVVIILHDDGVATVYAHLQDVVVSEGQRVSQGQTIGSVGTTGWATGPHLYFEVRIDGKAVDPLDYLPRR